jgi:hypothetical protein
LEDVDFRAGTIGWSDGVTTANYQPHLAFLGVGYEENEQPMFNVMDIHMEGLNEWHCVSGFSTKFSPGNSSIAISYAIPEKIQLWAGNGFNLTLVFSWTMPAGAKSTQVAVRQNSYLRLESQTVRPFEEFSKAIAHIRDFLCFALDVNISITKLVARSPHVQNNAIEDKNVPQSITLYFESVRFQQTAPTPTSHKALFNYAQIMADPQGIIQRWVELMEQTNPAMRLFLSARAGELSYLNFRFLSIAQALETFHHRFTGTKQTQSLRLTAMIADFSKFFGKSDEQESLVKQLVDTRNYYTHYNPKFETRAAEGADLWDLYCKAEILFQLHMLKAIGFDDTAIAGIVEKNSAMTERLR